MTTDDQVPCGVCGAATPWWDAPGVVRCPDCLAQRFTERLGPSDKLLLWQLRIKAE